MITEEQCEAYRRDGVVCLPGAFIDWLEPLRAGVDRNMAEPGPLASEHRLDDGRGRFFEDYCNWQRIPEYRSFIRQSPAAAMAAALMDSQQVQIYHEHLLVKEPGTSKATPWHHDIPYYNVTGTQVVSFWIALDSVPQAVCPSFVVGSHRWGELFYPRFFDDGVDYPYQGHGYKTVPDIDASPEAYDIRSWGLEAGDAIAFHFVTLHAAPGNEGSARRRGLAVRFLGDDVRFTQRPGRTSPPYPDIGLGEGDPLREDWFPIVWTQAR